MCRLVSWISYKTTGRSEGLVFVVDLGLVEHSSGFMGHMITTILLKVLKSEKH